MDVTVFWIPLGAGARVPVTAVSGRLYEALAAARHRRPRASLFHAVLEVSGPDRSAVAIEMTPAWLPADASVEVASTGPVGLAPLGRSRWFRWEVRLRHGTRPPDAEHAVGLPSSVATDDERALRLLALARSTPALVWGRAPAGSREMWNSNSLVAWLLAASGHDLTAVHPPPGGRAPGWAAGVRVAGVTSLAGAAQARREARPQL